MFIEVQNFLYFIVAIYIVKSRHMSMIIEKLLSMKPQLTVAR